MSSNDLTQVRGYIKSRVLAVMTNGSEWLDSLEDIGNIPKTVLDRTFHLNVSAFSSSPNQDQWLEDSTQVIITIFKRAYNKPTEVKDELLQTGNCIRLSAIDPLNVETYKRANDGNIEDVQSVAIIPSAIDVSNDNIIKVEIELNVRLFLANT